MTYAYVTTETCRHTVAVRRGTEIDGRAVSRHGDYTAWPWNKTETLEMMRDMDAPIYRYRAAKAVAELLGWLGGAR